MKTYTLKSTKRRQGEVKFEIRNSKYETNSEDEKSKLETVKPALDFVLCPISDLFRISSFGFTISGQNLHQFNGFGKQRVAERGQIRGILDIEKSQPIDRLLGLLTRDFEGLANQSSPT